MHLAATRAERGCGREFTREANSVSLGSVKFPASLINNTIRILYESLHQDIVVRVARIVDPDFDIYRVTGFPESIPIPPQECAKGVVLEMIKQDRFVEFVEALLNVSRDGLMGRRYTIRHLGEIVKGMAAVGLIYDNVSRVFIENPQIQVTPNWGRLLEGQEYFLALLKLDIVENSKIVRAYPPKMVQEAYRSFHAMVVNKVQRRHGRIWSWEGDGGMVAFYFGHRQTLAVAAALDILQSLLLFNLLGSPLETPLQVRLAVHAGNQIYSADQARWGKAEVAIRVQELESQHCQAGELVISQAVYGSLENNFSMLFAPKGGGLYSYKVRYRP